MLTDSTVLSEKLQEIYDCHSEPSTSRDGTVEAQEILEGANGHLTLAFDAMENGDHYNCRVHLIAAMGSLSGPKQFIKGKRK